MSSEINTLKVKMEIDSDEEKMIGVSCEAEKASLYVGHIVKQEMVVGPELILRAETGSRVEEHHDFVCIREDAIEDPSRINVENINDPLNGNYKIEDEASRDHPCFVAIKQEALENTFPEVIECVSQSVADDEQIKGKEVPLKKQLKPPKKNKRVGKITRRYQKKKPPVEETPLKCLLCGYSVNERKHFNRHLRTHKGEKPFKCETCEFRCNTSQCLKNHIRIHTGEKPFKCTICDYRCSKNGNLKRHLLKHTGDKRYQCTECGYKCSASKGLKIHIRTHTGEKPYQCSECERRFTTTGQLQDHLRTHSGEKPYECKLCDYKSTKSGNLKRHLQTHTSDKRDQSTESE